MGHAGRTFGYVWPSGLYHDIDEQKRRLRKAGCDEIFVDDEISDENDNARRPVLGALLTRLRRGDRLMVCRLDRLGSSIAELADVLSDLKSRGIAFISLSDRIDSSEIGGHFVFTVVAAAARLGKPQDEPRSDRKSGTAPGTVEEEKPL